MIKYRLTIKLGGKWHIGIVEYDSLEAITNRMNYLLTFKQLKKENIKILNITEELLKC